MLWYDNNVLGNDDRANVVAIGAIAVVVEVGVVNGMALVGVVVVVSNNEVLMTVLVDNMDVVNVVLLIKWSSSISPAGNLSSPSLAAIKALNDLIKKK